MNQDAWQLLEHYSNKPFIWGESDCFLFAAHMQSVLYGCPLYHTHKGQYHSKRSAILYFNAQIGKRNFNDAIASTFSLVTHTPCRGDIILRGSACGIYLGRSCVFRTKSGLTTLPICLKDKLFRSKSACQIQ